MHPAWTTLSRAALLLAGLLGAGFALGSLPDGGAKAWLDELGRAPGAADIALFVALGATICAIGLPRQTVAYAGGYLFGLEAGIAWAMLAEIIGCAANFAWARSIGRQHMQSWLARRPGTRLHRINRLLAKQGLMATIAIRLLPIGHNATVNLLAGLSSISAVRFLLGSAVGFLPQTIVFALLGNGTRLDSTTEIILGSTLFATSALFGVVLLRRMRGAR